MSIYAISDLHGQYDIFLKGLSDIKFSDNDFLYVIGDAIDRGPDGIRILQYIQDHKNMDLLIGNHEFMMLDAIDVNTCDLIPYDKSSLWLNRNGGVTTYRAFESLSTDNKRKLLFWLQHRCLTKTIDVKTDVCDDDIKFVLTHSYYSSALDDKCYCELNRESNYALMYDAVWLTPFRDDLMCDDVYSQYDDRIFVIGHVPIQNISANKYQLLSAISGSDDAYIDSFLKPYCWHNVIDIDGGLSYLSRAPIPCAAMFFRLNDGHVTKVFST